MVVINREQVTHVEMSWNREAYIYFNGYALKLWVSHEADQEILFNFIEGIFCYQKPKKQVPNVIKTRVMK